MNVLQIVQHTFCTRSSMELTIPLQTFDNMFICESKNITCFCGNETAEKCEIMRRKIDLKKINMNDT